jgi:hypothetical protein
MNRGNLVAPRRWATASCLALTVSIALTASLAQAQRRQDSTSYGPESNPAPSFARRNTGPNVSYQSGPHTRIYITKRSWLDAGVEVKPGDRHYLDYVMPPGNLQYGINTINGPGAPAGFQNPNWPLLGRFEAPDSYRVGW